MNSLDHPAVRPSSLRRPLLALAAAVAGAGPACAGDFCFNVVPYAVEHSPSCVVQGDLNGDGWLDLVVANHEVGEDTISVLMNIGAGTFAPAVHHAVSGRPYWLGVGDVDADLDADVVVSNFFGHTVAVLLNDGTGALGAPTDYFVGFFPTILALARLDGDDDLDIAVASSADAAVAILMNNGDGTFAEPVSHPVSLNPYGVTAGDFDNDGALDLAVANYDAGSPSVSLLRNLGDGTFADQILLPVEDAPVGIGNRDLDGDGFADLVVTIYGPTAENDKLALFINDGAGGFPMAVPYTVGTGPYWIEMADVNDDGHVDIVSANTGIASNGTISVLLNAGDGTFGPTQFFVAGNAPGSVTIGDLDGDTSPELVTASYDDLNVYVLFNQYPAIVSDPVGLTADVGDEVQFTVAVVGPPPFTFQWRLDGVDLVDDGNLFGANSDTLTIAAASASDAGTYDVVVTNECGSLTSTAAELAIGPACSSTGDMDESGAVDGADLGLLLGAWGRCPPAEDPRGCCAGDLSGDGQIDGADLGLLLGNWTP